MDKKHEIYQRCTGELDLKEERKSEDRLFPPMQQKYDDVTEECSIDMTVVWKLFMRTKNQKNFKIKMTVLRHAVKQGIPPFLRNKAWIILKNQWNFHSKLNQPTKSCPKMSSWRFAQLLSEEAIYHHQISIDVVRTFSDHPVFNQSQYGKSALFNILKAYSILDKEVGYCQGLNNVAGFLLIQSSCVKEAFEMLIHIMFRMDFRKFYIANILTTLKLTAYQLKRLLQDFHPNLYKHFKEQQVSLMLFVPQWFLTMFTSVLPLNFTARVFDLIFLEGLPALFKIALCLLSHYKAELMQKQGFESIVTHLKDHLSALSDRDANQIFNEALSLDIVDSLLIYKEEHAVLKDEEVNSVTMQNGSAAEELNLKYSQLLQAHRTATKYNLELAKQLDASQAQRVILQQELTEMAEITKKRTQQYQKENECLRRICYGNVNFVNKKESYLESFKRIVIKIGKYLLQ